VRVNKMPSEPARSPACILVVEDEFLIRAMVSETLREAGLTIIEAFNADEAICILQSGVTVDLLFSDVRMPGSMDGLGLLEHSLENFPTLPVVMTSGHLLPADALAKGARRFLGKPYSFDDAIAVIVLELAKSR
jgi:CheY-like chemotaxis protein